MLEAGDLIVDGGNANYHDSERRAGILAEHDIQFMDAGTSGGIWGLENGYCLMVGGSNEAAALLRPVLEVLAPGKDHGWAHVGPVGAGHFTKMIHNGIEYGMMQAIAEGFALLQGKKEFQVDLAEVAELWRYGSVVRSWLLDLTVRSGKGLDTGRHRAGGGGFGRRPLDRDRGHRSGRRGPGDFTGAGARFSSQGGADFGNRVLAMMRKGFGGHAVTEENSRGRSVDQWMPVPT